MSLRNRVPEVLVPRVPALAPVQAAARRAAAAAQAPAAQRQVQPFHPVRARVVQGPEAPVADQAPRALEAPPAAQVALRAPARTQVRIRVRVPLTKILKSTAKRAA